MHDAGDSVRAANDVHLNDVNNDGNNVYAHTLFYFYGANRACGFDQVGTTLTCWWVKSSGSTGEFNYSNTPVFRTLYSKYDVYGSLVRGQTQVCVQLGWPIADRCSSNAITTYGY